MYWCSSCGGCEESILDLGEDLLALEERADIVFWPIAMDAKYGDIESMPDGGIALTLINGAIRDDAQEKMARLLRQKTRILMAHGSCAHLGGVVGLANLFDSDALLDRAYRDMPTLGGLESVIPLSHSQVNGADFDLPALSQQVKPLGTVVKVDFILPGCPPPPELIHQAITAALDGTLPENRQVIGDEKALCHTCPLLDSKPEIIRLKGFKRLHETRWASDRCYLDQALICLGPVTRGGCLARCIRANMPCRGCFGPLDAVSDFGARALSMLAASIDEKDPERLSGIAMEIPDLIGLVYRYSLAASLLKGRVYGK